MKLPLESSIEFGIDLPDWDDKIKFNSLSDTVAHLLNNGYIQVNSLESYLSNNGDFLADSLRDKLNEVYSQEKVNNSKDDLFWAIVNYLSPKPERSYQIVVIILMAKYFETCDIFEEPMKGEEE